MTSSWSLFRSSLETAKLFGDGCAEGKTYLVTGPYSGIGVETVRTLLQAGASKVILGGRSQTAQSEFMETLERDDGFDVSSRVDGSHTVDLGDLQTVRDFCYYLTATYKTIDVVICNAGVMNTPCAVTKDGIERQMGTNVVGHFLLCKSLVPITRRQVWLASYGHTLRGSKRIDIEALRNFKVDDKGYDGWLKYQQSKLGNILMAKEFGKRFNIETVSLHPGTIYTNLYRSSSLFSTGMLFASMAPSWLAGNATQAFPKTASQGAATSIFCALSPRIEQGAYYSNCAVYPESLAARNAEDAAALFDYCDEVTSQFQSD